MPELQLFGRDDDIRQLLCPEPKSYYDRCCGISVANSFLEQHAEERAIYCSKGKTISIFVAVMGVIVSVHSYIYSGLVGWGCGVHGALGFADPGYMGLDFGKW